MKKILVFLIGLGPWISAGPVLAQDAAGQQFQGFNLQGYSESGEKAWAVNGSKADILGDKIKISDVAAESYGEEKMNLTAESGTINQADGNIHLEKDVIITSQRGTQMTTDSLDWNRTADLVKTKDPVVITDKDMTLTGKGMEAKPGLKTAQIEKNVTATMDTDPEPEVKKTITITSDGPMTMDQSKSYAVFEDNVVAVQEDQTLKADRMEIYFNQEQKQIKELVCSGHVVIIRGANQSFADKAVYTGADQKLTLSGRPKLILVTEGNNAFTSIGN
ncbi:MAG: LPS export ABC transporter periplasmic protein LptC [Candidatus Omnitrophica bacterium]|nr:LPS export ABC transporter periplasmic protein LptC [Candidatus Omnitrophota bacterium]